MPTEQTVLLVAQVGSQLIPIITLGIATLRDLLKEQDVDPAIYARIEAAYLDRIAQADAEAASHGHPVAPA